MSRRKSRIYLGFLFTLRASLITILAFLLLPSPREARAVDGRVIYGDSTTAWVNERAWTAGDFGAQGNTMTNTADAPWWVVYHDSPVESIAILGTQVGNNAAGSDELRFQCFDQGTGTWNTAGAGTCNSQWNGTVAATLCTTCYATNGVNDDQRMFDFAFESLSGDAVIVYEDGTSDTDLTLVYYDASLNTINAALDCDGGGAGPAGKLRIFGAAALAWWVTIIPKPNSDDMMILVRNNGAAGSQIIRAVRWNGSANTCATVRELGINGTFNAAESAAFAWETSSGDGLACAGRDSTALDLQCWDYANGTDLFTAQLINTPVDPAGAIALVRMASNPNSDYIAMIIKTATGAATGLARGFIWTGAAWEASPAAPTGDISPEALAVAAAVQIPNVDVAWEHSGGQAIFTYVDANSLCVGYWRYLVGIGWNVSAVGTPGTGTTTCITGFPVAHPASSTFAGDDVSFLRLFPSPVSDDIMLVGTAIGGASPAGDIRASRWDGDSWAVPTTNLLAIGGSLGTVDDLYGSVAFAWVGPKNKPHNQSSFRICNDTANLDPLVGNCDAVDTNGGVNGTGVDWSQPTDAVVARHLRVALDVPTGAAQFDLGATVKLQYGGGIGSITNCGLVDDWTDIGDADDTNRAWRGYDATPADNATITANRATATVLESYEESLAGSILAASPANITAGSAGEWGFQIENYNANAGTDYCFRIVDSTGDHFARYSAWPRLSVAGTQNGMLIYGDSAAAEAPRRRTWTTDFNAENADTPPTDATAASAIIWVVLKNIQGSGATGARTNEKILGDHDAGGQLNFWTFDGTTWTQQLDDATISTAALSATRAFDAAYEQRTGSEALIVRETATAANLTIGYHTWNGTTFVGTAAAPCTWNYSTGARGGDPACPTTAAATCTGAASGVVRWVKMVPQAGGSDIMVMFEDSLFDLYAVRWNSVQNTFIDCQQATATACNNTVTNPCFDFAWYRPATPGPSNRTGILVYGTGTDLATRTYSGTPDGSPGTWGAAAPSSPFGPASTVNFVRLATDPGSPTIAAIFRYVSAVAPDDVQVWTYSGSTGLWTAGPGDATATDVQSVAAQNVDVAWETGTGKAIFVYVDNLDLNVKHFRFDRVAGTWSTTDPDNAPDAGAPMCDDVNLTLLRPSPSSQEVMLVLVGLATGCAASAAGDEVQTRLWDGGNWRSTETMRNIEDTPSDASSLNSQPVDFVWTRKDPTLVELVSFTGYSRSHESWGMSHGSGDAGEEASRSSLMTHDASPMTSHEVVLEWETGAERSNAGFNVYRGQGPGDRVQVNQRMIQGLGTSARGRKYVFVDDLAELTLHPSPFTLHYYLEDIEFNGTRTLHGPIEIHVGLDSDGDGMPDDWERYYGCHESWVMSHGSGEAGEEAGRSSLMTHDASPMTLQCLDPLVADADGDADGDGISNLLEYLNGTMPTAIESAVWITDLAAFQERGRWASCGDRSCFDGLSTSGNKPAHPEPVEGWRVVKEDSTGIELECERNGCNTPAMLAVPPGSRLIDSPGATDHVEGIFRDQTVLRVAAEATPEDTLRAHILLPAGSSSDSRFSIPDYRPSSHDLTHLLDSVVLNRSRWALNGDSPVGRHSDVSAAGSERSESLPTAHASRLAPSRRDGVWLKIPVSESGIYKITRDDAAAAGIDPNSFDPSNAKIFVPRFPIPDSRFPDLDPLPVQSDAGALYFHAVPAENKFTRTNSYWLQLSTQDPGLRTEELLGLTQPGPADEPFQDSLLLAPGPRSLNPILYWQEMPGPNDAERFFFAPVLKDGDSHDYIFELPALAAVGSDSYRSGGDIGMSPYAQVHIGLTLLGLAEASVAQNHKVEVSLNGARLGELTWQGRELYSGQLSALSDQLKSGKNTLTIKVLLVEGAQFDQVLLKSATIPFYRPSRPALPVLNASLITHYASRGLSDAANRTDYIMILPARSVGSDSDRSTGGMGMPPYEEAIAPLKAFHESRGLAVKVVTLDQVYDEFGGGLATPYAIKNFLAYAFRNWQSPKPSYVLLVGDATYDYKDYEHSALSTQHSALSGYVPTYLLYTPLGGEIPSDAWFVSFDDAPFDKLRASGGPLMVSLSNHRGEPFDTAVRPELVEGGRQAQGRPVEPRSGAVDLFPDMAIGRLPARTPDELSAMVDKILHYADDDPESDWRRNVLLVADNFIDSFEGISESLFDLAPGSLLLTRGYMSLFPSPAELNAALVKEFNSGAGLINYVGHGSAQYWGAEKLLAPDQLKQLENLGRYPFISTLTCINGYFVFPPEQEFEAMAEEYVRAPGKGAVAFFAPSGMSSPAVHGALNRALYKAITQDRINPIGAAIQKAYLEVAGQISAGRLEYVPQMFVLFGDPAMDLLIPASDPPPTPDPRSLTPDSGCSCSLIGAPGGWGGGLWALSGLLGLYAATRLLRRRSRIP